MLTNCKNCGAVLVNGKCEYCGSEYEYIPNIGNFQQIIKINIHGKVHKFYISKIGVDYGVASVPHIRLEMLNLD